MPIKVLLRIRSDVGRFPGGDHVQLLKTREALQQLGVEADVLPGVARPTARYDLVHIFNTTRIHEPAVQFRQARAAGTPVAVSTIWHSNAEMQRFYAHLYGLPYFPLGLYQGLKEAYYARRSALPQFWPATLRLRALQREIIAGADVLLPNSRAELEILKSELGVTPRAAFIVPYGFSPAARPVATVTRGRDVVCAGRIEPRKNQLSLIRAFKRLPRADSRLLLYGAFNEGHDGYSQKVRAELVPGWVEYGGCISQEELYAAFSRAAVVVLASFFETCGLVVLEALACGANACVSRTPYLEDYYGSRAVYCDPYDVASMAEGLAQALARPSQDHTEYLRGFTWQRAGEETLRGYEHVLSQASPERLGCPAP